MKRTHKLMAVLIVSLMIVGLMGVKSSHAWVDQDHRSYHHWIWETEHATMINALLITESDCFVKHNERFVELAKSYDHRDPLLEVYGLRKQGADSDMDAFLVGLKANNLIYLIHVADDNPIARKLAVKELRLLADIVRIKPLQKQLPYWADLLEEGRYSSKKLSHIYVHYIRDFGDYFHEEMGNNKRFFFWLGYLINDFTVANMCNNEEWLMDDQDYLTQLYGDRRPHLLGRYNLHTWWQVNTADLTLKKAVKHTQACLDLLKKKHMNRDAGPRNNEKMED